MLREVTRCHVTAGRGSQLWSGVVTKLPTPPGGWQSLLILSFKTCIISSSYVPGTFYLEILLMK